MTMITENSEYITQLVIIVWCAIVSGSIAYVLPMIKHDLSKLVLVILCGCFATGFLTTLHRLLIDLNVY